MRSWTVPAVLAALLSAAAAQACLFKCCFRSAGDDRKVQTTTTATRFLKIVSVDGKSVVMTATPNVNDVNPSHDVEVVVNADYLTGSDPDHIDLVLTEVGPRSGPKVATTAAGGKKHHKLKWKALITVSTTAAAPSSAPGGVTRYWECHFTLPCMPSPELQANYKYTLQAFYPDSPPVIVQSDEVSVWTAP